MSPTTANTAAAPLHFVHNTAGTVCALCKSSSNCPRRGLRIDGLYIRIEGRLTMLTVDPNRHGQWTEGSGPELSMDGTCIQVWIDQRGLDCIYTSTVLYDSHLTEEGRRQHSVLPYCLIGPYWVTFFCPRTSIKGDGSWKSHLWPTCGSRLPDTFCGSEPGPVEQKETGEEVVELWPP